MNVQDAARIAHEVNRAYCFAIGDESQATWEEAPDWQKESAIKGVLLHWSALEQGRVLPPSASHESWLEQKRSEGWKHGPVKDAEKKEHPCFIPYEQLPQEQRIKDYLFGAVAHSTYRR